MIFFDPRAFVQLPPRSLTGTASEKLPFHPIGKACLPFPPFFRGKLAVKLRRGFSKMWHVWVKLYTLED